MLQLQQLLELGIKEFVICAGARNLPIIQFLSQVSDLKLWTHFEERSAGFFALGRTMATNEPCAVVCTSGTAVAELLPAVVEAYYQARPLVILSADRPASYRASGAPQAIEQQNIFSDYVEFCYDITEQDKVIEIQWSGKKPLHLNICLNESETCEQYTGEIGIFKRQKEQINVGQLVRFLDNTWDGLVVAVGGLEPDDREEVYYFLKRLNVPLIIDATSGLREALSELNLAQPESTLKRKQVGKVLRIGEVPIGRFWRDLETSDDVEVLSVTRTGFSGLARESTVVKGEISRILKGMGDPPEVGDVLDLLTENQKDWAILDEMLERFPDSEPAMIKVISQYATLADQLYLGNSLPVREWNQFSQRDIPIEFVQANRGANGIDGQIATWLGWTAEHESGWAILGDLTTMYDMSSLALLPQILNTSRVLIVINNSGGKIFERLPSVMNMPQKIREKVLNEHTFDFSHLAAMWGMGYTMVEKASELEIEPQEKSILVEVRPSQFQTEQFWKEWEAYN